MRLARLNPGFVVCDAVMTISKAIYDGKTLLLTFRNGAHDYVAASSRVGVQTPLYYENCSVGFECYQGAELGGCDDWERADQYSGWWRALGVSGVSDSVGSGYTYVESYNVRWSGSR